jgi:SSS family solute:Na+ symporter
MSFDFNWDTISVYVLLCFGLNFYMQKYASDQTVVQRYLLSPTNKQASRALWISSALIMIVWVIFMSVGALLWAYYDIRPELLPDAIRLQPDKVFPYFIGHQIPTGISGLILAALLAATMSTLSSDLNSLSAILYDDYYNKIKKQRTSRQRLLFSRLSVLITGLLAVLLAMSFTRIKSMADAAFNFVSLVAGGVLGMYLLGICTSRCSKKHLYFGLVCGVLFILWAYFSPDSHVSWLPRFPLHILWIGLLGNMVVFSLGYLASLVSPTKSQMDRNLASN